MNIRRLILWFGVAVLVVLALVIWFAKKPAETSLPTVAETNTAPPSSTARAATTPQHKVNTNAPAASVAAAGANIPASPQQDKKEQMRDGLAALNDVSIVFYGKLEDQFGNPVAGAEITGSTIVYNGTVAGGQRVVATSDANGFFQLKAGNGESLGLMPRKSGYVLATTNTAFKYSGFYPDSRHVPDPDNPVVIKMWKLQGAESLVGINQRFKYHFTDAPVNFDLLTGKIVPTGGDIKVTVSRSPGIVSERTLQDWSVQIEVVDGGLIETSMADARVAYMAPDNGYQPSAMFIMSTNAPNKWFGGFDQMFFVQSRGGQVFSKVFVSMSVNTNPDDPMSVTFRGVANANGSRNWEGDPNTYKPQ